MATAGHHGGVGGGGGDDPDADLDVDMDVITEPDSTTANYFGQDLEFDDPHRNTSAHNNHHHGDEHEHEQEHSQSDLLSGASVKSCWRGDFWTRSLPRSLRIALGVGTFLSLMSFLTLVVTSAPLKVFVISLSLSLRFDAQTGF